MPGGRERNIVRWELRASLLRDQITRLDERLARLDASDADADADADAPDASPAANERDELLAQRAALAHELDAIGPDPHAKMG